MLLMRQFLLGKENRDVVIRRWPRVVALRGLGARFPLEPRKGLAQIGMDTGRVTECRVENGLHHVSLRPSNIANGTQSTQPPLSVFV